MFARWGQDKGRDRVPHPDDQVQVALDQGLGRATAQEVVVVVAVSFHVHQAHSRAKHRPRSVL
jgi:hypothetical protein